MTSDSPSRRSSEWILTLVVATVAAGIAAVSARPYAGSWNDGSRLATVEAIVDYHTFAIDHSAYLNVPSASDPEAPNPYDPSVGSLQCGTGDRILVGGHYYSHKSPVPSILMAGLYGLLRPVGLSARQHPGWFAWVMCLGTSGTAFVLAAVGVFLLGGTLGLPTRERLILMAGLAFSTTAVVYSRQANDHILLLALAVWLLLGLTWVARGQSSWLLLAGLGTVAGLAYAVEMGAGPLLLFCALGCLPLCCRRMLPLAVFALAAVPWVALHHAVNWSIGGTLVPAASVPEFFRWPGSHFDATNMTGTWKHADIAAFLDYALGLLVARRGFLGHNFPVLLALPALAWVCWQRGREMPVVVFGVCWSVGVWLLYAAGSNNYAGCCCSIRWLVPLLGPGFYLIALLLRDRPEYRTDLVWLSVCGVPLTLFSWWVGPWTTLMPPGLRGLQIVTLLGWAVVRWRAHRRETVSSLPLTPVPQAA